MSRPVSLALPNFNGRDLLARYLPTIVTAADNYDGPSEIVVVDDGSSDGSAEWVRTAYPNVRIVGLVPNRGALVAKNECFRQARYRHLICLNNDVELAPSAVRPLLQHFDDPAVFGVSAKVLLPHDRNRDESVTYPEFRQGRFHVSQAGLTGETLPAGPAPILYPHGGACAYDRAKLLALGGYDPIYHPIYWDDLDVGYAAWKRGWRVVWEPAAVAYHQHQATMRRVMERRKISRLFERNLLLFTWKHIHDPEWILVHIAGLAARLAWQSARARQDLAVTLGEALLRTGQVSAGRRREQAAALRRDRDVFELLEAARRKNLEQTSSVSVPVPSQYCSGSYDQSEPRQ